jgi:hypothetical protein
MSDDASSNWCGLADRRFGVTLFRDGNELPYLWSRQGYGETSAGRPVTARRIWLWVVTAEPVHSEQTARRPVPKVRMTARGLADLADRLCLSGLANCQKIEYTFLTGEQSYEHHTRRHS